jgi:hypothetical protein
MRYAGCSPRMGRAHELPRLLMILLLAGCASPTAPAPPVAVLAAAAATCHHEVAQAVVFSGQFDLDEDHAYTACMRRSGWEL